MREMKALSKTPHMAFDIYPSASDLCFWKMTMEGPATTPYKDGIWLLYVSFPEKYPDVAPEIRFITPIKHCNVNCYGRICHSILDRNYTSDTSMATILQCIYGLLLSPDVSDPLDSTLAFEFYDDSGLYETSIVGHTNKFARTKTRQQWKEELSQSGESGENENDSKESGIRIRGKGQTLGTAEEDDVAKPKKCANCGLTPETGKLKRCGKCKKICYCSVACQKQHFKIHKQKCKKSWLG